MFRVQDIVCADICITYIVVLFELVLFFPPVFPQFILNKTELPKRTVIDPIAQIALPPPLVEERDERVDVCPARPTPDDRAGCNHRKLLQRTTRKWLTSCLKKAALVADVDVVQCLSANFLNTTIILADFWPKVLATSVLIVKIIPCSVC